MRRREGIISESSSSEAQDDKLLEAVYVVDDSSMDGASAANALRPADKCKGRASVSTNLGMRIVKG